MRTPALHLERIRLFARKADFESTFEPPLPLIASVQDRHAPPPAPSELEEMQRRPFHDSIAAAVQAKACAACRDFWQRRPFRRRAAGREKRNIQLSRNTLQPSDCGQFEWVRFTRAPDAQFPRPAAPSPRQPGTATRDDRARVRRGRWLSWFRADAGAALFRDKAGRGARHVRNR
jgi:hypothetical protein